MNSILIVIPTYKEENNIEEITDKIFSYLPKAHILFVDDASPDRTEQKILECAVRNPGQVFLLKREKKLGLGSAYIAGFIWGISKKSYEYLIQMDADLSHNPAYLPLMQKLLESNDVVIGSRYVKGGGVQNWSILRKIISRLGSFYARKVLNLSIFDLTGGFNGWKKSVFDKIRLDQISCDGYAFQIELKAKAIRSGYSITEFPILFEDRRTGQSKMSLGIILEAIWKIWLFRKPFE